MRLQFLTLLLLPSALYAVSDLRLLIGRRRRSRLELEPAYSGD